MRLHREAHGPHHHVGIFRIDILIDNDDHFVGRISARGGLERLPGLARVTIAHADDPPIPTPAHLRTTHFQHLG